MKTREKLVELINSKGLLGNAIEIGVAEGSFANHNIKNWNGDKYFMVDPWTRYAGYNDLLDRNDEILENQFMDVAKKYLLDHRTQIVRTTSLHAAQLFPDNFFDWIYIDANHQYEFIRDDIDAWFPKCRSGGCFSGHDYKSESGFGVIRAVDDFVKKNDLELNLTDDDYKIWWIWKP